MFASFLKYQSASYFNYISTSKEREKLTFYIFVAKVWFTVYYMHKLKKKKKKQRVMYFVVKSIPLSNEESV